MFPRLMVFRADRDIVARRGEFVVINPNGYIETCTPAELAVRLGAVDDIAPPKPVVAPAEAPVERIAERAHAQSATETRSPPPQSLTAIDYRRLIQVGSKTEAVAERRLKVSDELIREPGGAVNYYMRRLRFLYEDIYKDLTEKQLANVVANDLMFLKHIGAAVPQGKAKQFKWHPASNARAQ